MSLAAALTVAASGATIGTALAQAVPGGTGSGGNVTVDGTARAPGTGVGNGPAGAARPGVGSTDNPAGVIDGTNPNPNPGRAGGIASPERSGAAGSAIGR